jgi:hypothetical protein
MTCGTCHSTGCSKNEEATRSYSAICSARYAPTSVPERAAGQAGRHDTYRSLRPQPMAPVHFTRLAVGAAAVCGLKASWSNGTSVAGPAEPALCPHVGWA